MHCFPFCSLPFLPPQPAQGTVAMHFFFFPNDLSVLFLPLSDCISSAMGLHLPVLVMLSASGNC